MAYFVTSFARDRVAALVGVLGEDCVRACAGLVGISAN